ncbi:MAG: alpha-L-fucosidase [Candidatus Latescibacteria bacterium]|nr:alpha-L-fucosidase [Candidatus Latescibacterota bacterium]
MTSPTLVPDGPFQPDWSSLSAYQVPSWYKDGKFGIFIHWGVYSVPAFENEWYPLSMYQKDSEAYKHHIATYGPHTDFGYKDFIPLFKAEKYDPDQWADLFRKAGARFVVPVAEHHDGFAMYDTLLSDWCAGKMGPKRDLVGELAEAVRKHWMTFGVSSHRAEHWWFMNGGMDFESDVQDPKYAAFYGPAQHRDTQPNQEFLDDWLARSCELVDRYQPQLFWFDWWIKEPAFEPYLKRFAAYYYNRAAQWERGVAINYKFDAFPPQAAVFDVERGQLDDINPDFWQTDTSLTRVSWGYVKTERGYKSADQIIGDLADIVSKNGALLLNVGPKPDGTIPEEEEALLLEIGAWMQINGEAIYDSTPWKVFGEGPTRVESGEFTDTNRNDFTSRDIRFTRRGDTLYAILLAWPTKGEALIQSLGTDMRLYTQEIDSVRLLGCNADLKWSRSSRGLRVRLPDQKPCDHVFVLKITPGS